MNYEINELFTLNVLNKKFQEKIKNTYDRYFNYDLNQSSRLNDA